MTTTRTTIQRSGLVLAATAALVCLAALPADSAPGPEGKIIVNAPGTNGSSELTECQKILIELLKGTNGAGKLTDIHRSLVARAGSPAPPPPPGPTGASPAPSSVPQLVPPLDVPRSRPQAPFFSAPTNKTIQPLWDLAEKLKTLAQTSQAPKLSVPDALLRNSNGLAFVKWAADQVVTRHKGMVTEPEGLGSLLTPCASEASARFIDKYLRNDEGVHAIDWASAQWIARNQEEERIRELPELRKKMKVRTLVPLDGVPVRGSMNAPVTVVMFGDLECPFTARAYQTMGQLLQENPAELRLAFFHNPLDFHTNAMKAACAAVAADRQGKFWEFLTEVQALHLRHSEAHTAANLDLGESVLRSLAERVGLNLARFDRDRISQDVANKIRKQSDFASKNGAGPTPSFFLNGFLMLGAQSRERFSAVIDELLRQAAVEFDVPPVQDTPKIPAEFSQPSLLAEVLIEQYLRNTNGVNFVSWAVEQIVLERRGTKDSQIFVTQPPARHQ